MEKSIKVKRAKELLEQMTVKEKIGQLCQRLYGFRIYEIKNGEIYFTKELEQEVAACGGLGTLYGLYRADPWSGRTYENGLTGKMAVKAYNKLQKYVLEHSRLSIPVMMSSECPHGHQALDGYILPVNLAVGASFSPECAKEAAQVCARQMKELGVDLALVSGLDILRDPRWGRSEECFGEDPCLASHLAKAVTEGMQSQGIGVVAKHFCAQGETTGGVNASAARIGERELAEIHLSAARACCQAGVKGIMAAYNEIDGIYCHVNRHLLQEILRDGMGFEGIVMADGIAIDQLDAMTGDNVKSAAAALNAGVDVGLWDQAFSRLEEALERGLVSMEAIDRATLRVLELKLELGLFDKPYIGADGTRCGEYPESAAAQAGRDFAYSYEKYPQSRRLAEESVILLKNEGHVLPLGEKQQKIAVIGPNADDIYRQIGDYSPPLPEGAGKTIWQGLKEGKGEYRFSDGASTERNLQQAEELAAWSDVTILVLGGSSSRFEGAVFEQNGAVDKGSKMLMDCGEGADSADLLLPGGQSELFARVRSKARKLVTVIVAGRPYAIPEISRQTDGLLYAFYPGPLGGAAIADIIYGRRSPMGRLPASLPRSAGQLPVYYNYRKSYRAMNYCNEEEGPLYSFGEGFGYSEFSCSDVKAERTSDGAALTCVVENTGEWEDAMVLQCYRRIQSSEVVPRVRELKAFQKIWLRPGEKKHVTMELGEDFFLVYGAEGQWKKEKGEIGLCLMDSGRIYWEGIV